MFGFECYKWWPCFRHRSDVIEWLTQTVKVINLALLPKCTLLFVVDVDFLHKNLNVRLSFCLLSRGDRVLVLGQHLGRWLCFWPNSIALRPLTLTEVMMFPIKQYPAHSGNRVCMFT